MGTKSVLAVLFSVLLLCAAAFAQTTNGTIVGDLTDAQGAALTNANITVKNTATGVSRTTVTNEFGNFRVFPLNPGTYEVSASAPGFKSKVQPDVLLEAAAVVKHRTDKGKIKDWADFAKIDGIDAKKVEPIKSRLKF